MHMNIENKNRPDSARKNLTIIDNRELTQAEWLAQAEDDAEGTRSENTIKTYAAGMANFDRWCSETGYTYSLPENPVHPRALKQYIADRAKTLKPASVDNYVTAINAAHYELDLPEPNKARVVQQALIKMRRKYGTDQKQAEPLLGGEIKDALKDMGNSLPELRDKALIWLAYDTLCRGAELVSFNCNNLRTTNTMKGKKYNIWLARSKADQEARGQWRFVSPDTFDILNEWMDAARLTGDDPLFIPLGNRAENERLKSRYVSSIYKKRVGEDFTAHSTRIGGAIAMMNNGATTAQIQREGGWRSDAMVSRYTEAAATEFGAAAALAIAEGRVGSETEAKPA